MTAVAATRPLFQLSTAELSRLIGSGELSPVEVLQSFLDRIDAVDGKIKAWSYLDREAALIAAHEAEAEIRAGRRRSALHGIPFGIKEQFALAGVPTLGDWKDPNPPIAEEDATVVARLKEAGAVLLGKLYMVGPSGTPPTRNPFHLEHTPGGSSSGSGAAVGARMAPFTLSEQTAGSGIRPAAYNGVAGLKPTYGRVSRHGMFPMAWSHDHACIIGQTIEDVALVYEAARGHDPKDPSSRYEPVEPFDLADLRPPKVGVVRNFFPELTKPVVLDAIEAGAAKLRDAGAQVVDATLPDEVGLAWMNWMLVGGCEGSTINAKADGARREAGLGPRSMPGSIRPTSRWAAGAGQLAGSLLPATYYLQAQRLRRHLTGVVAAYFARTGFDALLMGTAPDIPPKDLSSSGDWSLLVPWSHLGNPAVSIPGGLSPEGLPLGLQLVGPLLGDEGLLRTAAWCEEVIGRLGMPPLTAGDE
jgi:aspartyl-tRNA(Asn)/glutamyl-tRNA(Gln) amidotransferase subunit A